MWEPTNEWMIEWQQNAPIQTILQFLDSILPKIKPLLKRNAHDETIIFNFLKQNTAVGMNSEESRMYD